jgi:hypothetical protein
MISSRPEQLPNLSKPWLFKAKSASNIRPHIDPMIHVLEKKHFTQGCAGLIVHALLTLYRLHDKKKINKIQDIKISHLGTFKVGIHLCGFYF